MKRPIDLIPHRPPWLTLDRVRSIADGEVVVEKAISAHPAAGGPGTRFILRFAPWRTDIAVPPLRPAKAGAGS